MGTTTMTMKVDKGALRAAHRIFNGVPELIGEALQNASRAGSTTVDVTVDTVPSKWRWGDRGLKSVTISDNGVGMETPDEFFTLGKNGWNPDETGVDPVEAAGWGAFSYVMEGVKEVYIVSSTQQGYWSASYGPQHLDGVTPIEVYWGGIGGVGTTIQITFDPEKASIWSESAELDRFKELRWTYPMEVRYNGVEVESPVDLHRWRTKTCDLGTLRWRKKNGTDHLTAIEWEHTKVGTSKLRYAINDLMEEDDRYKAAAGYLDKHSWYFVVNTDSGLRPDLPARRNLVDNAPMRALARWIADVMWETLWDKIEQDVLALPDTVTLNPEYEHVDFIQGRVPKLLRDLSDSLSTGSTLVDSVMRFAGYKRYEILPPNDSFHMNFDWNSSENRWAPSDSHVMSFVYYSKEKHVSVSRATAQTIMVLKTNGLGQSLPLVVGTGHGDEKIALGDSNGTSEHILFTTDIKIKIGDDFHHLPWLIVDPCLYEWNRMPYDRWNSFDWVDEIQKNRHVFLMYAATPATFNMRTKETPLWMYPLTVHLAFEDLLETDAPYAIADEWVGGEIVSMYYSEDNMLNMLRTEAMMLLGVFKPGDLERINEITSCLDSLRHFAKGYIEELAENAAKLSNAPEFAALKDSAEDLERAWNKLNNAHEAFENSLR